MSDSAPIPQRATPIPGETGPSDAAQEELQARLRAATLGDYDIYGELGRGGMATVFLAHELALDRKVAIKVMAPALTCGPGMVERFKREARTAAHLSHPNIIPIYAVREAEGLLFFVMKLVEGTPLDSIMRELGRLPVPMVEAILAQVGGAFGYAHRRGVVHRDIKPSNILIDEEGWAVVTDFGIAKVLESEALTQTGAAVGTPTYMSPEQCSGGVIAGGSDQYSLGVVAYEMLTGKPPFTGNMMALMFSHFHEAAAPLEQARPDCPEPLRRAVMRMLEKDPAARWPSMEEAVAAMGGARQLSLDEPTRTQLVLLARSSETHRIVSQVQTPRSPIPLTQRSSPGLAAAPAASPPRPGRGRWLAAATGLAAVLGVLLLLQTRQPAGAPGAPDAAANALLPPAAPTIAGGVSQVSPGPAPSPPPPASVRTDQRPAGGLRSPGGGLPVAPAPGGTPRLETAAPLPDPPAATLLPPVAAAGSPLPPQPAGPESATAPLPPAAGRVVDEKVEVLAALNAYARALEAGDLAQAQRIYPGMPADQRQGLEAFWNAGGTLRTRWSITDVAVTGEVATARVQGSTVVTTARERPSEQRVNLRARLERRGTEWRLVALVN